MGIIRININESSIPIPFYDKDDKKIFELSFSKTDENLQRIMDYAESYEAMTEEEASDLSKVRENTKASINATLTSATKESPFDLMYGIDKSLYNVNQYYMQIAEGIIREMQYEGAADTLNKYRQR